MFLSGIPICLAILGIAGRCDGANILLLPLDHHPNVNIFSLISKSLIEAGHNVTVLAVDSHKDVLVKHNIPHIVHSGKNLPRFADLYDEFARAGFRGGLELLTIYGTIYDLVQRQCEYVLDDKILAKTLEDMNFDFALVDAAETAKCSYIFPYRLDIPYITFTTRYDPWLARVPALPSVEGFFGVLHMSNEFYFKDRIVNTVLHVLFSIIVPRFNDHTMVARYAPNKPSKTLSALFQNSEMFLVNTDTLCLDSPRVTTPHYQFVDGMNNRPAEPLPEEFDSFVNGAEHGIIVVSFGSIIKIFPDALFKNLLDGFGLIDQKVIMRYHGNVSNIPNKELLSKVPKNVKLVKWLPQNDLLGHPKTKLFITHTGNNGQSECVYHGIPMLSIPIFDDQFYNAQRAENHGFGLQLDWQSLTPKQLVTAIKELITNPKYKNNIRKCMEIVRDFPTPQERITFWVEHVLRFGSSHLRPSYIEMPLWKFFMLDILLIFALFLMGGIFLTYWLFCICIRKFWANWSKQKRE